MIIMLHVAVKAVIRKYEICGTVCLFSVAISEKKVIR